MTLGDDGLLHGLSFFEKLSLARAYKLKSALSQALFWAAPLMPGNSQYCAAQNRMLYNAGMSQLTISEVARQVGLRPSAIRYYERLGILPPALCRSGQRRYDSTVL